MTKGRRILLDRFYREVGYKPCRTCKGKGSHDVYDLNGKGLHFTIPLHIYEGAYMKDCLKKMVRAYRLGTTHF